MISSIAESEVTLDHDFNLAGMKFMTIHDFDNRYDKDHDEV